RHHRPQRQGRRPRHRLEDHRRGDGPRRVRARRDLRLRQARQDGLLPRLPRRSPYAHLTTWPIEPRSSVKVPTVSCVSTSTIVTVILPPLTCPVKPAGWLSSRSPWRMGPPCSRTYTPRTSNAPSASSAIASSIVPWAQSKSTVAPESLTTSPMWSPPHSPGGSALGEATTNVVLATLPPDLAR